MKIDRALLKASWESWISSDNRPRAGPYWLQWLWTVAFSLTLAVPFTVLGFVAFASGSGAWRNVAGWVYWYGKNAIVCLTIGVVIHLLFDIGRALYFTPERIRPWKAWQRTLFFSGTPLVGVVIGWPIGVTLAGMDLANWAFRVQSQNAVVATISMFVFITFVLHHWFSIKNRQIEAERRATEAQLLLLQGQMEPHFLFNTLANVQSLMDHDLPRAKQMLASFTEYLRSSLGTLRQAETPLAHELELARRYLELLQGRMEERLRFRIEADEAARRQPLPPLLLQPLVENAVVHGLEPQIDGGSVTLSARVQGQELVLEVRDDGRGPDAPPRRAGSAGARRGSGMALANLRERLLARYGSAARLELLPAMPGTVARITLPLAPPLPATAAGAA